MSTYRGFLVLCFVGFLTGCYSIQARYSFDSETDFSGLKTYAWLPGGEAAFKNPSNAGHYQKSMDKKLASKGFVIDSSHPDFLIYTYRVETYKEKYLTMYGKVEFPKAMIRVDFLDTKTKTAIWEGAAEAHISEGSKPEEARRVIDQVINNLLKDFPPG